jgi:hypothetical protein
MRPIYLACPLPRIRGHRHPHSKGPSPSVREVSALSGRQALVTRSGLSQNSQHLANLHQPSPLAKIRSALARPPHSTLGFSRLDFLDWIETASVSHRGYHELRLKEPVHPKVLVDRSAGLPSISSWTSMRPLATLETARDHPRRCRFQALDLRSRPTLVD